MKTTKAANIQVRLLVEESQQLNSKKWKTRKKAKFLANEMILISNYAQKDKRKNAIKWNKRRRAIRNWWIFFLTIYHSCSFVTLLFQQRCQVKWPPWSLEDLPIKKGRKSKHFTAWQHQIWRSESMVTVNSACFKIINLPHEMTWYMYILVLML